MTPQYEFERTKGNPLGSPKSDQVVDMALSTLEFNVRPHLADTGAEYDLTTPPGKPIKRHLVITSTLSRDEIIKAVNAGVAGLDLRWELLP